MRKILFLSVITALIYSCSSNEQKQPEQNSTNTNDLLKEDDAKTAANDARGIGKFTNVELSPTLDAAMAKQGNDIYDLKCSACHKLTNEKLVGPGWAGVTTRRKAEWVMNFATNPDEMLNKDPQAQAMLEECLVRMPNQNLNDAEARSVYEFMRKNDGLK